jgi:hypothetical protein
MGIGSAPGITNVLARLGADALDSVASIDMVNGAVDLSEGGGAFGVPYSAETILDEFTLPAMVFEDGELREVAAGSGVVEWAFPEPIGTQPAMYTLHSEPATLPRTVPGFGTFVAARAFPRGARGVRVPGRGRLASRDPVMTSSGPVVPRDVLAAVLNQLSAPDGEPADREVIDVRVAGTKEGREAVFRGLARFSPSPEACPPARSARRSRSRPRSGGRPRAAVPPGVHPPETAFEARAFLRDLEAEGVGGRGRIPGLTFTLRPTRRTLESWERSR